MTYERVFLMFRCKGIVAVFPWWIVPFCLQLQYMTRHVYRFGIEKNYVELETKITWNR